MSKRDWKLYVEDVLECVRKVEKYTDGMDFASFKEDDKTIDAVVKNLVSIPFRGFRCLQQARRPLRLLSGPLCFNPFQGF